MLLPNAKDVAERALNVAALRGAGYADVRIVERRREDVTVKLGRVEGVSLSHTAGFGVRVLLDGSWGFASSADLSTARAEEVAAFACAIARASARVRRERATLAPNPAARDTYRTPVQRDPFSVPMDERIALLLRADEAMRRAPQVAVTESSISVALETKAFASSEGSYIEQELTETGCGIEATAVFDRARLPIGARLAGPSIVEQPDTTTVIPPGYAAKVEASGNLRIRRTA